MSEQSHKDVQGGIKTVVGLSTDEQFQSVGMTDTVDIRLDLEKDIDGIMFVIERNAEEKLTMLGFQKWTCNRNLNEISNAKCYSLKCIDDVMIYKSSLNTLFLGTNFLMELRDYGLLPIDKARTVWKLLLDSGRFEYER
jgi:hypothetical protein